MLTLAEALLLNGRTIATIAAYVQQYLDEHWQTVWQTHLPHIERVYATSGDSAYAVYSRALFSPLADELRQAGVICQPRFPGAFSASWEQGPWEERTALAALASYGTTHTCSLRTLVLYFSHA
jgi:hypothetical protein